LLREGRELRGRSQKLGKPVGGLGIAVAGDERIDEATLARAPRDVEEVATRIENARPGLRPLDVAERGADGRDIRVRHGAIGGNALSAVEAGLAFDLLGGEVDLEPTGPREDAGADGGRGNEPGVRADGQLGDPGGAQVGIGGRGVVGTALGGASDGKNGQNERKYRDLHRFHLQARARSE
jgi:hypothetical protein